MRNVMTKAWKIARESVAKFGSKAKEYFAEALKLAWATLKSETGAVGKPVVIRKEWTTTKGAKVVFEYKTEKEVIVTDLFEQQVTRTEKGIFPTFLSVNGNEISTWNTTRTPGKHELSCGVVKVAGQKAVVNIEMPEEISIEIYGELEKPTAKKVNPLRCPKCGEFCYSDCSTH